ncbi:MAG: lysophospholipid acyltransferase family protein [Candidatus Buchananbacteria bacterium]
MRLPKNTGRLIIWLLTALRALILLSAFFCAAVICCALYMVLLLFLPRKFLWRFWVRPCGWICLKTLGQQVAIEGDRPDPASGPYLYLLNHQSLIDAFLAGYAMPHRITGVGADKYFKLPIWGWMAKAHGIVPISNKSHEQAIASIRKIEGAFKAGESLLIFPEGERSKTGRLQEFKKGAFHLAKNVQPVIIPCVIRGAYESWRRGSLLVRPGTITFKFLKPIMPEEYQDLSVDELKKKLEMTIAEALN